ARVQADHVPLGVVDQGDEAVLADGLLRLLDPASELLHPGLLHRAVLAGEVDEHAVLARGEALVLAERAPGALALPLHREGPVLEVRSGQLVELEPEHLLVERLRSLHVLHVDLEPTHSIAHVVLLVTPSRRSRVAQPDTSARIASGTRTFSCVA